MIRNSHRRKKIIIFYLLRDCEAGWRMHCGAEVTESSTNKQHHLSKKKLRAKLYYLQHHVNRTQWVIFAAISPTLHVVCVSLFYVIDTGSIRPRARIPGDHCWANFCFSLRTNKTHHHYHHAQCFVMLQKM